MYLLYIRKRTQRGQLHQGSLFRVHFKRNEKGDYTRHLFLISNVYEMALDESLPASLIYPVKVTQYNGRLRLFYGLLFRQAMLHLIDCEVRESFFFLLRHTKEAYIEVTEEPITNHKLPINPFPPHGVGNRTG